MTPPPNWAYHSTRQFPAGWSIVLVASDGETYAEGAGATEAAAWAAARRAAQRLMRATNHLEEPDDCELVEEGCTVYAFPDRR